MATRYYAVTSCDTCGKEGQSEVGSKAGDALYLMQDEFRGVPTGWLAIDRRHSHWVAFLYCSAECKAMGRTAEMERQAQAARQYAADRFDRAVADSEEASDRA